jgi:fimbrial chaperone protein
MSRAALAILAVLVAAGARAGSFQVNPIRLDLSGAATSAAITVRNDGSEAVVVQASVLEWKQVGGNDVYAPTADALVTPPVATIPAGGEQVVRVGLRRPPDPRRELSYRVFVQEVPPPPEPGFAGLRVSLRLGVPVFVAPTTVASRPLEWAARIGNDGTLRLSATNAGNSHHRITDFALRLPGDEANAPVASISTVAYVLAGQTRDWEVSAPLDRVHGVRELKVRAFIDAGETEAVVKLDR